MGTDFLGGCILVKDGKHLSRSKEKTSLDTEEDQSIGWCGELRDPERPESERH